MPFDPKLLLSALRDPAMVPLSDTAAAAALSIAIIAARPGLITSLVLNRADVWGFAKTSAVKAALNAAVLNGQTAAPNSQAFSLAAQANNLIGLLDGPGLIATDPQVATVAAGLVLAGLVTQADLNTVLTVTTFRCGVPVTAGDVTTARARLTAETTLARLQSQNQAGQQAVAQLLAMTRTALSSSTATTLPTAAQLIAAYSAKVTG